MSSYALLKKVLFRLNPEHAHTLGDYFLRGAKVVPALYSPLVKRNFVTNKKLSQNLFGRTFYNPVGLGAGFDKNATMVHGMVALGFGFTEVGTVTPREQKGNKKPRLFRHINEQSLQNAMGFNNNGMSKMQAQLRALHPFATPIGINIGKNKGTSESRAIDDYSRLVEGLHELGDYLVVNISSPNTPGLRDLQNEKFIEELFKEATKITNKPILLKIAPDMSSKEAIKLCKIAVRAGASGIIATNTTLDYSLVKEPKSIGGISGAVLKEKSFKLFEDIAKELYGKTTLISVGGIDSAQEAYRRLKAGASLVQVYSALIFNGPSLIGDINRGVLKLMEADGYSNITEVIGSDRK